MNDIAKILTHIIFSFTVAFSIAGAAGREREAFAYGMWMALLAACCYVMRRKMKKLALFLCGHLALVLGGMVLCNAAGGSAVSGATVYLVIALVVTLFSLIVRLASQTEWLEEPGCLQLTCLGVLFFLNKYLGNSQMAATCSIGGFLAIFLLGIWYRNLVAADTFISSRASSTKIDEMKLKRINNRLSLLYITVLGVILALTVLLRTDGIGETIWGWVKAFLRFLFSWIDFSAEEEELYVPDGGAQISQLDAFFEESEETSALAEFLNAVLEAAALGILVAAVAAGLIYLAVQIYRHFYSESVDEDEEEQVQPLTVRERLPREKRKNVFEIWEQNPAKRIRRLYKKHMRRLRQTSGKRFSYMPPQEQLRLLRGQSFSQEEIEELLRLYEKARYSDAAVTEEEAERVKNLFDRRRMDEKEKVYGTGSVGSGRHQDGVCHRE